MMTTSKTIVAALFVLVGGCSVKDLELPAEDTDTVGSEASGDVDTDPSAGEGGGTGETSDLPPLDPVPGIDGEPEAWAAAYAEARCAQLVDCGCAEPLSADADYENCVQTVERAWVERFSLGFGDVLVEDCLGVHLDLLEVEGCEPSAGPPLSWQGEPDVACHLYEGSVPSGDPCATFWAGSWAESTCAEGLVCEGLCRARPSEGEACLQPSRDLDGALWQLERDSLRCADGLTCIDDVCVAYRELGESCAPRQCADGLFCDAGSCAPRKPGGEACTWGFECESARCWSGSCQPRAAAICNVPWEQYPPL